MAKAKDSCVEPAKGPIGLPERGEASAEASQKTGGGFKMTVQVGKPALDFEANAFVGEGFKPVKLSDFKGKWVVLCFYPGDFTFV